MATKLLESIQQQLTPTMIAYVSSFLGESPAHTQTALDEAIPTVLVGLMDFSSSDAGPTPLLNSHTTGQKKTELRIGGWNWSW